jgi:isocitrate dehydrogenase
MANFNLLIPPPTASPPLFADALLPIIRRFAGPAGIDVEKIDISLASRILCQFPEKLTPEQRVKDSLAELGQIVKGPDANVIKLPNVSASVPQLVAAIAELQGKGFAVPNFSQDPKTADEKETATRYARVLGSAVNPVLREGNSDRRVAAPVKAYARKNPHKLGAWPKDSKTRVQHMTSGDYFGSEKSVTLAAPTSLTVALFPTKGGAPITLKSGIKLDAGDIADAATMSVRALNAFYAKGFAEAKKENLLASLHLKATMMKVSDPVFFGHAVKTFFASAFAKHADVLASVKANPNNGYGDVVAKIATLPAAQRAIVEADFAAALAAGPALAMVDSRKGITNLHVPSDIIIDASMPCVVRDSGRMWNKADELQDTLALIPDRCYATIYDVMIKNVQEHGQFDVTKMGSTANVGLMAQKAEEYGSHPTTFEVKDAGVVKVTDAKGAVLFEHKVEAGDVWRLCTTKDAAIKDWVKLAVTRTRASKTPAIFWLDSSRAHDAQVLAKAKTYLSSHDTKGLDITFASPQEAMKTTCAHARAGRDCISVTGNVLRDYLTDLFPILELGTSAKMLSIVPMMAGGAMYETGAGGSAPKHVQQFLNEGHLRWDSLGEYLAMATSFEDLGARGKGNADASKLGAALLEATNKLLDERKSPSRKVKELDNRGSSFYIALFWAQAMAKHNPRFTELAKSLDTIKEAALKDMIDCQGVKCDVGGYYMLNEAKANTAMRPSKAFNALMDKY